MSDYSSMITTEGTDYVKAMQQSSNPSTSAPSNVMGQEDFLRLLTTQLQNQDPSKPMDPTSFVTDLTQMNQLEATTRMNESIMAMTKSFQGMQTMQAATMIGKNVQVDGEDFSHTSGSASQFRLTPEEPLEDATLVISSNNGMVREISLGSLGVGEEVVSWDGLDDQGNEMPSGVYSLTAYGTSAEGDLESINSVVASQVSSVSINDDGSMTLTLATGERVSMDSVREIGG